MKFELDIHGDKQVSRELLRWGEAVEDARELWRVFLRMLESREERQFATQGGYASGGWMPITHETIRRKERKGLDLRILHATHRLRDSLTKRSHPDAVREYDNHEMKFGTKVPYAGIHQNGGEWVVRRRPVELTNATRKSMVRIMHRFVVTGAAYE